ncbi:hypothetical protein CAPTEDRAFT_190689 [Capitella teleta]|uniref:Uncharacterized protein n=1 Tax=Capitella teleta TaxID=283909 RepID=R7U3R7_CAPTE|nr:hypothetical protein CAPTEDRAFT_190689 [Capitella teleta]|eukprot:ELU00975.1 hypothetical protein CAPTEDRAFT_190689 [Capitella teleta]
MVMNIDAGYTCKVRAVWFENGREVEGVAPGTWIKRGTVFWLKGTNAEPAYLDREELNEKTWRSFKLVKVKFTSDKEEDCHEYDATTAEEGDDQDNRRGVKRKKEEDFLYEMDETDGALEQILDDMSNDQTKDKGYKKLNKVLRRLSSSKKKQREDFRKSAEVRTAQEPKIRISGDQQDFNDQMKQIEGTLILIGIDVILYKKEI